MIYLPEGPSPAGRAFAKRYAVKNPAVYLFILLLYACSSTTTITGSWKNPSLQGKNYESIVVVALTSHAVAKSTVENDIAALLREYQVSVKRGIDILPPKLNNSDSDYVQVMNKLRDNGVDGILTISLLKEETESQYVPGGYSYDPFRFDYYRNF